MKILIIGTTLDDISFLKTKLFHPQEEIVAKSFPVTLGEYGGKNVVLAYTGYGQELASIATSLLLQKYEPYVVVNVGMVSSLHPGLEQGDIYVVERIYLSQVSMMELNKSKYGQFPSLPAYFQSNDDLLQKLKNISEKSRKKMIQGRLLSSNVFYTKKEEIEPILKDHYLKVDRIFATDTESGGVALACHLFDIPYVGLKICNYTIGKDEELLTRIRMGVRETPIIGQILTHFLRSFQSYEE